MSASPEISYFDAFWPGLVVILTAVAILPLVNRNHPVVRCVAIALCVGFIWRYLIWRLLNTVPGTDHPLDFVLGVAFASVETLYLIGATATMIFLARTRNRSSEADRNLAWLASRTPKPLIDVLICTYNEDQTVLERTIVGALATQYPNARIWVCDDTRRPWLRTLCEEFGVGYLTRPDNAHAKAGNINSALAALAKMDAKPEFVAILDADFVPLPEFLSRSTALMRDRDVGVVQTPQHFFNDDPIQHNLSIASVWPDEQRFFFDVVMASKDAWGAAFCCGTSSVIRFDALMAIGGFPTNSVTEDYLVSLRLRQEGFRTVYLNEALSFGLAPEGLAEYSLQRSRWCLGFVQICRSAVGPLKFDNGLPFVDRIMLLETFLYWSANHAFRLFAVVAPALYLLFGVVTVDARAPDAISHLFPLFAALASVYLWLMEWRLLPILAEVYQLLSAPEVLRAVAAGLLRPKGQKFKVTAKGGDRSRGFVQWPLLRLFLSFLALNLAGIVQTFFNSQGQAVEDCSGVALIWTWYNIVVLTIACFVCVEQPRRCDGARFPTRERFPVARPGGVSTFLAADLSVTGVRLFGDAPVAVGEAVTLSIGGREVEARLARLTEDGFALEFAASAANRIHLIRYIFSGRHSAVIKSIRPGSVARGIIARILGAPRPT